MYASKLTLSALAARSCARKTNRPRPDYKVPSGALARRRSCHDRLWILYYYAAKAYTRHTDRTDPRLVLCAAPVCAVSG
jgi:hypothetical protein